jgi:hypothetical protein
MMRYVDRTLGHCGKVIPDTFLPEYLVEFIDKPL